MSCVQSAVLRLTLVVIATNTLLVPAEASALENDDPWGEPRLAQWSKDFLDGRGRALLADVRANLLSASPSPHAPYVWLKTAKALEGTTKAAVDLARKDDVLWRALGPLPEVMLAYDEDRLDELRESWRSARLSAVSDPWVLVHLSWAYDQLSRYDDEAQVLRVGLRTSATQMFAAWQLWTNQAWLRLSTYAELAGMGARGGPIGDSPAAPFIRLVGDRKVFFIDAVDVLRTYLERRPHDPWALRLLGVQYSRLGRLTEAAEAYAKAFEILPFQDDLSKLAGALWRAGRNKEAEEVLARWAPRFHPDAELALARHRADAFTEAGEKGKARAILEDALTRWPDDYALLVDIYDLEQRAERHAQALGIARHALHIRPNFAPAALRFVEALRANGDEADAYRFYEDFAHAHRERRLSLDAAGADGLGALGRKDEQLRLLRDMAAYYPQTHSVLSGLAATLAQHDQKAAALAAAEARLHWLPNSRSASQLWELTREVKGEASARAALEGLRRQSLEDASAWDELAKHAPNGGDETEAKLAVYRRAQEAVPQLEFPYDRQAVLLLEKERYAEAEAVAVAKLRAAARGTRGAQLAALLLPASVASAQIKKERVSAERIDALLGSFEQLRVEHPTAYFADRRSLLEAAGRKEEAAEALLEDLRIDPDSRDNLWQACTTFGNETGARGWAAGWAHFERDPYDGTWLGMLEKLHAMWGGSPIVSLWLAHIRKERLPGFVPGDTGGGEAERRLGAYAALLRDNYLHTRSIGNSSRYIDFFKDAVANAPKEGPEFGFPFDPAESARCPPDKLKANVTPGSMTWAALCFPNGQVVVREDHPVHGKPVLVQRGAVWVRANYDGDGNLNRLDTSAGGWVLFDEHKQIREILTSSGRRLRFQSFHGEQRVSLEGVGQIRIVEGSIESDGGRKVLVEIVTALQETKAILNALASDKSELPFMPLKDKEVAKLEAECEAAMRRAASRPTVVACRLRLASQLTKHVADDSAYEQRIDVELADLYSAASAGRPEERETAVGAIALYLDFYRVARPAGLSPSELKRFGEMQEWLAKETAHGRTSAARLLAEIEKSPPHLTDAARWLDRSDIRVPGFWRKTPFTQLAPRALTPRGVGAMLIRRNGDVLVGTNVGLAVRRRGYFEWFGFDEARRRFSATLQAESVKPTSEILALAEDASGALWVATANGLIVVGGDYSEEAEWLREEQGLPAVRVTHVALWRDGVVAGGKRGLRYVVRGRGGAQPDPILDPMRDQPVIGIGAGSRDDAAAPLLIAVPSGLWLLTGTNTWLVTKETVAAATLVPSERSIVFLRGGSLFRARWDGESSPASPRPLPGEGGVVRTQHIEGLGTFPVEDERQAAAILTDRGLSLFLDDHVEHLFLPGADRDPGALAIAARGRDVLVATTAGLYAYERGQARVVSGRIDDLLTLPDEHVTLVASEDGLYAVSHDDPSAGPVPLGVGAQHLAHCKGGFLASDGLSILRFDSATGRPTELFRAEQKVEPGWRTGPVHSLLEGRDGTIWVAAGASVYRYRDGKVEEWSVFVDPDRFPARSEMISQLLETLDGRIWVIASNEAHLRFRGMVLSGGVLEWDGSGFHRLELPDKSAAWFITSYTPIDPTTAIVGSTAGFARHHSGRYTAFDALNDPTYTALSTNGGGAGVVPLWLGTRGARLGNTWIFGTAGGLVGYQAGTWFYPERLNWMLPDPGLADLGSRTVHAVETDAKGRIYVGTDRGLLIYDAGGDDESAFLLANQQPGLAFQAAAAEQLRAENEALLASLPPGSALATRVEQIRRKRDEIEALELQLAPGYGNPQSLVGRADATLGAREVTTAGLPDAKERKPEGAAVREKRKEQAELLARLENENPGLFQLFNPIDLAALREQVAPKDVIIQYLPTKHSLYVHVLRKGLSELREVKVGADEILPRALRTATRLAFGGKTGLRGQLLLALATEEQPPLVDELAWLYDVLLRPVEGDLEGARHVLVVPSGPLSYLPFGALVRAKEATPEYAVSRYAFGYLSSLYSFDLASRGTSASAGGAFVVGDPDGSLPGARKEAEAVAGLFPGGHLKLGSAATVEALVAGAQHAGVVHLATHGVLDRDHPERSYLLMGNGERLTVPEAMTLHLNETGVVALSACNSGVGRTGLEYATLARAFMSARAASVLATLWSVEDGASGALVEAFYRYLSSGEDRVLALTHAQRDRLAAGPAAAEPFRWAGYVLFGTP